MVKYNALSLGYVKKVTKTAKLDMTSPLKLLQSAFPMHQQTMVKLANGQMIGLTSLGKVQECGGFLVLVTDKGIQTIDGFSCLIPLKEPKVVVENRKAEELKTEANLIKEKAKADVEDANNEKASAIKELEKLKKAHADLESQFGKYDSELKAAEATKVENEKLKKQLEKFQNAFKGIGKESPASEEKQPPKAPK